VRYLATAIVLAAALPAAAQQPTAEWVPLPRPPESGKTAIYDPQFAAKAEDDRHQDCSPGLQCRLQLRGVIARYGGVVLRATAFSW
jgi:hypothetical protein